MALARHYRNVHMEEEEEEPDEATGGNDNYADGDGEPCPNCGRLYR